MSDCQQSDEVLWIAVQNNDDKAFNTLYYRYWKRLYDTVLHHVNDTEIAEQVVQDVFVILWKRRDYLTIENFAKYIHATARYHVFKEIKAKRKTIVDYTDNYLNLESVATQNTAELKLSYNDFQNQISNHLSPLPKRCKEIFWLSRIENLSNDEIAERFCISKRSVENQLTIALKHIRSSKLDIASTVFALVLFSSIKAI